MRRRTVALLSIATVLLWGVIKWTTDQIVGNFVAEYLAGLLSPSTVSTMTAALLANAAFLAIALAIVLAAYGLGILDRNQGRPKPTGLSGADIEQQPKVDFAHGLLISAVTLDLDALPNKKRNIQLGVRLENMTSVPMKYEVDHMFVSIDNHNHPNPGFNNKGSIIHPGRNTKFRYAVFANMTLPKVAPAVVSVDISYGPADGRAVRRLRRDFLCTLRALDKSPTITWSDTLNKDFAINGTR